VIPLRFPPQKILCPTDMSDLSRVAVHTGLVWARQFSAKAFVLMARELSLPPRYFTPEQIAVLTHQAEEAEDDVRADLQRWATAINPQVGAVEAVVGPGPADRAILRAVHVLQPDLVVMGTHGRSGYNRFLMGSVTEKVIREILTPVLIVPRGGTQRAGATATGGVAIRRILCAVHDPRLASANVPAVAELARAFGAEVLLLHSLETPRWLPGASPAVRDEALRQLTAQVAAHAGDLRVQLVVREGPAYQQILDAAAAHEVDLIVVGGRQGRDGFPTFGSTAVRVMRHGTVPVLALPG
jgi:nucleotide-binding universal stress UspA family protein